jgi:2-C-methyl-D-erythritol 4-phosphate cytidylyltransferase/2-C-methyl-D-erythritol 2,4-cyclodiphosphate synthase
MVRALGHSVAVVAGNEQLMKITFPDDLRILETMMHMSSKSRTRTAIGMGYDVHRLVAGKPLWLGGIRIEHSHGLSGHSDADAALHAITDAVLGALAEGDIGAHFPPSDLQWKGAASDAFLAFARDRVAARGGVIDHVDLTIICEAPKIGPHRDAMRSRIAEILEIGIDHVSVKATTTEGLGFAGRREGIAAQAVATLRIKEE